MALVIAKWSNVRVGIQSALGADKAISAITKANPATVSATAHGFTQADFILMDDIEGMFQLDSRVFRVEANASPPDANSFSLESENSTLYDTFVSGNAKLVTFGTNMRSAVGLTANGGDSTFLDATTIHDNIRKQIPGLPNAISYAFENIWDPADGALQAMKEASDNQAQRAIKFLFAGGQVVVFSGFVDCTLLPLGTAQEIVKCNVTFTMNGRPTIYATS